MLNRFGRTISSYIAASQYVPRDARFAALPPHRCSTFRYPRLGFASKGHARPFLIGRYCSPHPAPFCTSLPVRMLCGSRSELRHGSTTSHSPPGYHPVHPFSIWLEPPLTQPHLRPALADFADA